MIARRIGYLASGIAIAAAGVYLFVYLYRWEWNRALIAGVILVVAELALIGALILDKLRVLEKRLDDLEAPDARAETLSHIKESAPETKSRFSWLAGDGDLHVFVPVLMGAGVLFSGIAWLVERLARTTARPAMEHGLATRLTPLALPAGSFLTPAATPVTLKNLGPLRRYRAAFLFLLLAAAISISVDLLGDLTQNRPDAPSVDGLGIVTMEVDRNGFTRNDVAAARSLWGVCSGTVSHLHHATKFEALRGNSVLFVIEPAIGPNAQKRLRGCLDDATIDNLQARVLDISTAD